MKKMKSLKKGLHLYEGKELSEGFPITTIKPSAQMVYPLSQHIGKQAKPIVKVGDYVLKGQMIAEADGLISAPIHSSVSGTVKGIKNHPTISGDKKMSIIVENDFEDNEVEGLGIECDPSNLSNEEIIEKIKNAGIVGLGGAGFPSYIKLTPKNADEIDTVIVNGCECEPYLTCDHRIMLEKGNEIVKAMRMIAKLFKNAKIVYGIENNKSDSIKVIKGFITPDDNMDICELKTKYPQGSERSLIYAITGRKINSNMSPSDAKCIVINASTAYMIYKALYEKIPLIYRYMTVSGEGINNCNNYKVPIGMSCKDVIEASGGLKEDVCKVISGGPMTGTALGNLDVPVQKTSSAIIAFTFDDVAQAKQSVCIHCGKCVKVCPANLVPQMLCKAVKFNDFEGFEKLGGAECTQCGCCAYICPAKIPLTSMFILGKSEIKKAANKGGAN